MKKIGLLSDTHGWLNPDIFEFFKDCDEVWHAGDIGNIETAEELERFKPLRAVFGNIDDADVRMDYPMIQTFQVEDAKVVMTHIGGYPNRYETFAREVIEKEKPDMFVSGHSHILKIVYDDRYSLLHVNPGAAGRNGFHRKMTMVRFEIDGRQFRKMEVYEKDR